MKSLRHIGLAVVLSLGASQVIAMDAPAVKPGFFTKENAMQLWTSCKNGFSAGCNKVAAGYNKSVDFLKPYGTQALTWIKNHKKTSIAIAACAAVLAAAGLAYRIYKIRTAKTDGKKKASVQNQAALASAVKCVFIAPVQAQLIEEQVTKGKMNLGDPLSSFTPGTQRQLAQQAKLKSRFGNV